MFRVSSPPQQHIVKLGATFFFLHRSAVMKQMMKSEDTLVGVSALGLKSWGCVMGKCRWRGWCFFSAGQVIFLTKIEMCATHVCIVFKHQEWQTSKAKELACHSIAHLPSCFQVALWGFVSVKIIGHLWIPDTGMILYQLNQFQCLCVIQPFRRHFDVVLIADGYWGQQHCDLPQKIDWPAITREI